jgi:hypothetical protein
MFEGAERAQLGLDNQVVSVETTQGFHRRQPESPKGLWWAQESVYIPRNILGPDM